MCERLGASHPEYSEWRARQATLAPRMAVDVALTAMNRTIDAASQETYGLPWVTAECALGLGGRSTASVLPA